MTVPLYRTTKSNGKEYIRAIQRENELIYYNYWNKSPKYEEYAYELKTNAEYMQISKQNRKRFTLSMKEALKRFSFFECIVIALIGSATCSGGAISVNSEHSNTIKPNKELFQDISLLILLTFLSVCLACFVNIDLIRFEHEESIQSFYNHLVVRCFDRMKIHNKDLDQDVLRDFCPAMACAISNLMMANMNEADTKRIQKLAEDMFNTKTDSNEEHLKLFDKQLTAAMQIIEKSLMHNPLLYREIMRAYYGKIPSTFVLKNNQNTR